MRSKDTVTFTRAARREQMIEATIETVAERGLHGASLARIAERMGIAKGGILYHFSSRDELVRAALQDVYDRLTRHVVERLSQADSVRGAVRGYIVALVGYLDAHRDEVRLIAEGFASTQTPEDADSQVRTRWGALADLLDAAVAETGTTGVDTRVLAITVSGGIDALVVEALRDSDLDLPHAGGQLADLVDRIVAPGAPYGRPDTEGDPR